MKPTTEGAAMSPARSKIEPQSTTSFRKAVTGGTLKRLIQGIIIMLAAAASSKAEPLTIVENGAPRATIVVAASEPKAEKAAAEIQKYVEKMSGAKLPIVKEGEAVNSPISILVGHTAAAQKLGVKIPAGFNPKIRPDIYEEEGYLLQTKDKNIIVGGNSDGPYQGTLYAAYALLEKLGCRWYFPGDWAEIVPESKTLTVPAIDVKSKPDFPMRGIWLDGRWGGPTPDPAVSREVYTTWCVRVGFSGGHLGNDQLYPVPGDGSLSALLPPKEYAATHPEFYAMDKTGQREGKPDSNPILMLCLSNEKMIAEYIKNAKEAFEGKRQAWSVTPLGIGISPPDGAPFCYCTNCLAISRNFNYPTYVQERMQTEEVCELGVKLADAFPDKWVGVAAYALRETPPQGVKLRPNMSIMYAPISCCVQHPNNDPGCWRRQEMMKILKQWLRQTPHVWLYDYTPGFLVSQFTPEADVANFTINAPIYKEIGIKGFARQGSHAMMSTWISYYISAKLMWNTKADVPALKKDFYETFFGPEAGPQIQAWWDACEAALIKSKSHSHESWLLNHLYTVDFAHSIHKYVDAARKAKMTDKQRERFKLFELIVENFDGNAEMEEADKNLDYKKAAECATRMLAARDGISNISQFLIGKNAQTLEWEYTKGRQLKYQQLAAMTGGEKGVLVAPLPIETRFKRDRFNEGVIGEWYAPEFNDKGWGTKNTFYTWDQQDEPEDAIGHDYDGYGWYRATLDVPAAFKGKPVHFRCGGVINEGWVWVNGEYAGHKPHILWWQGGHDFDLDVTKLVRAGEKNTLVIRVWNNAEIGGVYRRGFLWSPK